MEKSTKSMAFCHYLLNVNRERILPRPDIKETVESAFTFLGKLVLCALIVALTEAFFRGLS